MENGLEQDAAWEHGDTEKCGAYSLKQRRGMGSVREPDEMSGMEDAGRRRGDDTDERTDGAMRDEENRENGAAAELSPRDEENRENGAAVELSPREQRFCEEYLQLGNAALAARRAGFSRTFAKNAARALRRPALRAYLEQKKENAETDGTPALPPVADRDEILAFLTAMMRRCVTERVWLTECEETSDWQPDANNVMRKVTVKRRIPRAREQPAPLAFSMRAAEMLARRCGLLDGEELPDADSDAAAADGTLHVTIDYGSAAAMPEVRGDDEDGEAEE